MAQTTLPAAPAASSVFSTPLIVLAVGSLFSGTAFSTLNIALPRIAAAFGVDVAAVSWVAIVQSLLMPGLLLPFGWLGDRIGQRRVYVIGLAVFAGGTVLSALAFALAPLVASRVIVTIGAAMMTAVGGALTFAVIPQEKRGQAMGWSATSHYIGLAVGPTVGGLALGWFDWPGTFWVAVPLLLVMIGLTLRFIPADSGHRSTGGFDWPASVLLLIGLGSLLLALTRGQSWGWTAPTTLGVIVTGVVTLAAFIWREVATPRPLLDLALFRQRFFAASCLAIVFVFLGGWVPPFLMPFYLIDGRGFGPAQAGLMMAAMPLVTMCCAPIAGAMADRVDPRRLTGTGVVLLVIGLLLLGLQPADVPVPLILLALAIAGAGIGLFGTPNNVLILSSVGPERRGTVSALTGTVRNIGIGGGVAIASAIYTAGLGGLALDPGDPLRFAAVRQAFLVITGLTAFGIVAVLLAGPAPKR